MVAYKRSQKDIVLLHNCTIMLSRYNNIRIVNGSKRTLGRTSFSKNKTNTKLGPSFYKPSSACKLIGTMGVVTHKKDTKQESNLTSMKLCLRKLVLFEHNSIPFFVISIMCNTHCARCCIVVRGYS